YQRVIDSARKHGVAIVKLRRAMSLNLGGGTRAEVLNPSDSIAVSPNNGSIGLRLRYGSTAIILAGDAEADAETDMAQACDVRADILKLSHHGSRTSSTPGFVAAVAPQAAVI